MFKGEEVVILTKKQADDINIIFNQQKAQIEDLDRQIKKIQFLSDSIVSQYETKSRYYDSILDRIIFLRQYIVDLSKRGAWLYYSYDETAVQVMDLMYYNVQLDDKTGDLLFMNMPKEFRSDPAFMTERENDHSNPPMYWERKIDAAIRPKVFTFPK